MKTSPTRDETLMVGYIASGLDCGFHIFKQALASWKVTPVFVDGDLAGMISQKGTQIHATIDKKYHGKWFSRKMVKDHILPILRNYGFVTTAVENHEADGHYFVKKFGFKQTNKDDKKTSYRLENTKWA